MPGNSFSLRRAGIVGQTSGYEWSSAAAHLTKTDELEILDIEWWNREGLADWERRLNIEDPGAREQLCEL